MSHGTSNKGKTDTMQGKIAFQGKVSRNSTAYQAAIAQLGERQTEDLKVPGSIPGLGKFFSKTMLAERGFDPRTFGL